MTDNSRPRPFSQITVLALLAVVVALAVLPLLIIRDSEFSGADGAAETAITEIAPDYEPWFAPLIELPGGETESLLFALQAAIGAGVIGYFFGLKRGQRQKANQQMAEQPSRASEQQTHASD
jgi:cobalt/nickel transport protein